MSLNTARRTLLVETVLVLGVSLGSSAVYAVLSFVRKATAQVALSQQTTTMNSSVTPDRPWLDLAYQLAGVVLGVVPALLAVHLLTRDDAHAARRIGADLRRPLPDLARGALLAAAIGIPGLALYLVARQLGLNTTVAAANLTHVWWAVPVLVLAAVQNAVLEEVVMVGYLFTRWQQAGWRLWTIILVSATIRGSYHLYQGWGGFAGNLVMGVVFGVFFLRTRRLWPLVLAHGLIDTIAFVGYSLLKPHVGWL